MIARRVPARPLTEHEAELWAEFIGHYLASESRPAVDVFLRGLIGAPGKEAA